MDSAAFEVVFKRLSGAFQWRGKPSDFTTKMRAYFDALQPFPLDQVETAAQVCRDTLTRFPRIVEWRQAIPATEPRKPEDARWMGAAEAAEYVRAVRQHYQDDPCACVACQEAGVSDRPLRYVPEFDTEDREERAWCSSMHAVVVVGHWAHGEALARWYAARDRFFAVTAKAPVWDRMAELVGAREPGEEG
jgi:hypothetical protein